MDGSNRAGSFNELKKLPFAEILELRWSLSDYNQVKNYDSWLDLEDKEYKDPTKPKMDDEIRWSTWEITSAMEYDMFWVPKLGDDNWSKYGVKSLGGM